MSNRAFYMGPESRSYGLAMYQEAEDMAHKVAK